MTLSEKRKNFIGVAWPYVNGDLHPGHIAGCYLAADIFARYKRLRGEEVLMVSGSDCFGTPITIQAEKENRTPKQIVEYYSPRITKLLLETYKISFDSFTKTDTKLHKQLTQKFFLHLLKNGFIFKKKTFQYYSEKDGKFLPDRYVEGICSFCKAKDQRGDQCEVCGRTLEVGQLINPRAKLTQSNVVIKETEHYFVNLKLFQNDLITYVSSKTEIWKEWVFKETINIINDLQERPITRDINWGVKIPKKHISHEMLIDDINNKRFYVWFDAVIGYFSESIKWAKKFGWDIKNFLTEWWSQDAVNLKHFIFVGKDNLFFHTIWWPSLIMGQKTEFYNIHLKLPDNVVVNQFLNLEGNKFSKSRGIYIDSTELVEKYGLDSVRFYITSIMPENQDSNWIWVDFINKVNNQLVANLGNFIHRTLTFCTEKLKITSLKDSNFEIDTEFFELQEKSYSIYELLLGKNNIFDQVSDYIEKMQFKNALNCVLLLGQLGNVYFDRKKPWLTINSNHMEAQKTIINCICIIYAIRILINPILPDTSDKISNILSLKNIDSTKNLNSNIWKFNKEEFLEININESLIKPLFQKLAIK